MSLFGPSGNRIREALESLECAYESRRLRALRNRHVAQRRCFLIGNGPSLRHQDLSVLRGEIVFVTNRFVLHPQHDQIAPRYYCVSDATFFDILTPELARVVREKAARMVSFVPYARKRLIAKARLFPRRSVYYVQEASGAGLWDGGTMILDPSLRAENGETVIIDHCLPLAHYMGFSEVFLLGCDTDYGVDRAADYSSAYFYDVKSHPPARDAVHHTTLWYDRVTRSYEVARRMFERDGRRICNATLGGRLEVFPRVDLRDLGRAL